VLGHLQVNMLSTINSEEEQTYNICLLRVLHICGVQRDLVKERDLVEHHKYAIPLSKHMLYVFSYPLLILDSILT